MLVDGFGRSLYDRQRGSGVEKGSSCLVLGTSAAFGEERKLLSDRKPFFSHLTPKGFVMSAVRVAGVQATNTLSNFLVEQIEQEQAREELVRRGDITPAECDAQNEEWERKEWEERLSQLPRKIYEGFLKYHAIILVMRTYEEIASWYYDDMTLDRLTMDYFQAGIRSARKYPSSPAKVKDEMVEVCFWSNVIAYLADYSVHQVILAYTYWTYYQNRRKQIKDGRSTEKPESSDPDGDEESLAISFAFKSSRLVMTRVLGLWAAAQGGAWGTQYWPGWGTMVGLQMGDGLISSLFDGIVEGYA